MEPNPIASVMKKRSLERYSAQKSHENKLRLRCRMACERYGPLVPAM